MCIRDRNNGDYVGKKYFYIFDYCKNFEYFRNQKNTVDVKGNSATLGERIFAKRVQIIARLQTCLLYTSYHCLQ